MSDIVAAVAERVERLERLGLTRASAQVKELSIRKRKMAIAYEHYRFVRQEKIDAFNAKLRGKNHFDYKRLDFTPLADYGQVPPDSVLEALEVAQNRKCFDSFEVAHIVTVKDPILFGRVAQCPDRFFIEQWDNDVKIEDILAPNEG